MCFQSKTSVFKFLRRSVDRASKPGSMSSDHVITAWSHTFENMKQLCNAYHSYLGYSVVQFSAAASPSFFFFLIAPQNVVIHEFSLAGHSKDIFL